MTIAAAVLLPHHVPTQTFRRIAIAAGTYGQREVRRIACYPALVCPIGAGTWLSLEGGHSEGFPPSARLSLWATNPWPETDVIYGPHSIFTVWGGPNPHFSLEPRRGRRYDSCVQVSYTGYTKLSLRDARTPEILQKGFDVLAVACELAQQAAPTAVWNSTDVEWVVVCRKPPVPGPVLTVCAKVHVDDESLAAAIAPCGLVGSVDELREVLSNSVAMQNADYAIFRGVAIDPEAGGTYTKVG